MTLTPVLCTHTSSLSPGAPAARRRLGPWLLLPVALVAAGVYANSLRNGFAFDDVAIVKNNVHVSDLMWNTIWTDNYWPTNEGVQPDALYRPLTLWTYLANEWLTPGAAWAFHLVNVLLHVLVTVLVSMFAWRLLGDRRVAVVTGLLFAVHPLHTEAVANVVGRAEELAACWTLLALLIYLPATPLVDAPPAERRSRWHGLLVALCFFAAILSKETPVTLLVALPFIDLWRYLTWPKDARQGLVKWMGSRFVRYYLPMGAFFAIYLALRINACGLMVDTRAVHPVVNSLVKATPIERLVTPFGLLARYLALTAWPVHLSADYSAPSIMPTANLLSPLPLVGILLCALAAVLSVRSWRKAPQFLLVVGMFFISYVLVSNAVRIGTIFGERLFYWPSAFALLLVAWAGVRVYGALRHHHAIAARAVAAVVLVAAMGSMSVRTWVRNTDWEDNLPLAIATGRDNPISAKACHWAGSVLVFSQDPRHVAFGKELLERAIDLYPDFAPPRWELAKLYGRQGDLGQSLVFLCRAVRFDPGTRDTRVALTSIRQDLAKADPATLMPPIEENLKARPADETAHLAMAIALHAQGKFDDAEKHAVKAVELAPATQPGGFDQFHEAAAELAMIRFDAGNRGAGVSLFREYVMKIPRSVAARCNLADMLIELDPVKHPNAFAEAEMNLGRAEGLDPRNPAIRESRAKLARKRTEWAGGGTASALPAHAEPAKGGQTP
jgi:tetratricopeptide (TPR) repeat protein